MPESKSAKPNRKATLLRGIGNSPGDPGGTLGMARRPSPSALDRNARHARRKLGARNPARTPLPSRPRLASPPHWLARPVVPTRGNQERFPLALGRGLNLPSRANLLSLTRLQCLILWYQVPRKIYSPPPEPPEL